MEKKVQSAFFSAVVTVFVGAVSVSRDVNMTPGLYCGSVLLIRLIKLVNVWETLDDTEIYSHLRTIQPKVN